MGSLKKTEINAILGEDFDKLLERLGVWQDFNDGKYRCQFCGEQVGTKNVLIIFPLSDNEIGFICKKAECLTKYKLSISM